MLTYLLTHLAPKRRLTIPPSLGYGKRGSGKDIPPDSTLVFEVTLKSIQ